jgi:hypothetical protein
VAADRRRSRRSMAVMPATPAGLRQLGRRLTMPRLWSPTRAATHSPRAPVPATSAVSPKPRRPATRSPQARSEIHGEGTARIAAALSRHRGQNQDYHRRLNAVSRQRDLNAVRAAHARVHHKRIAQREASTRGNHRRTDGWIGRSTALQHLDLGRAEQSDWLCSRVHQVESPFRLHVKRHVSEIDSRGLRREGARGNRSGRCGWRRHGRRARTGAENQA